jgi:DNA-binding MarR family transcriptional regulator
MEGNGLLTRKRCAEDERNLEVTITEKGDQLKELALGIPAEFKKDLNLDTEETMILYQILYKLLGENTQLFE